MTTLQRERRHKLFYLLLDAISGLLAYTSLHMVRKVVVEPAKFGTEVAIKFDLKFFEGAIITTLFFILVSNLGGIYKDVLRKSRLAELFNTIGIAIIVGLILFFSLFLDDYVKLYNHYYLIFFTYTGALLFSSALLRFLLSTRIRRLIDRKKLSFPTLLVGCGKEAGDLIESFQNTRSKGYHFIGYLGNKTCDDRLKELNFLGTSYNAKDLIQDNHIEEVIIALGNDQSDEMTRLISELEAENIRIHVLPNLFSILSGQVKMESLGRSLVEIKRELIRPHVAFIKRAFDIVISLILIVLTSPILLFSIAMVAAGSNGPIFYAQERLGKRGRKFQIIKLRSMYADSEKLGPQLSSENDPRITPWGRTMRKYRFDELPQFFNVLKGDMSIVGPRPERDYFFSKIIEREPQYKHLLRVKPGITSWGMVKFGYAENVDEMIERARYDLIYTENITLLNDIKILFYTLVIVLQGRGK